MSSVGSDLIGRVKKVWDGLSPSMRWLSLGLIVAVLVSLSMTWYLRRPSWVVFYKATDTAEVTNLTQRLAELNVKYQVTGDGLTIEIPSSDRSTANLAKAQAGLPFGSHVGLEYFAEPRFGATEFDKKVNLERAWEGELSRSLMRIKDIQFASVNLNIPEKSVYLRDRQVPTASVLVQPRPGRSLSKENVRAIMTHVAATVEGLTPDRVTVIDDRGVLLSKGITFDQGANLDSEALVQQQLREQQLQEKLLAVLEPLFGFNNVAVSVNLELDHETRRTEELIYGQGVPKIQETQRSGSTTQTTPGAAAGTGTTGAADGTPTPPPVYQAQGQQSNSEQFNQKSTTQFDYGQKSQVTVTPAGGLKRITAAVTINREELTQAQIEQIRELAANATGALVSDVTVLAMSFSPLPDSIKPPATQTATPLQPLTLAIGLGLASFFLLIAFVLTRRRRTEPAILTPGVAAHGMTGTTLDVALGIGQEGPAGQQAVAMEGVPGEAGTIFASGLTTPGTPAAEAEQRLVEVLNRKKPKRAAVDLQDLLDDDALADIDVLIDQAPEACAEVIRQWLKGGI